MIEAYLKHTEERNRLGIPPLPLNAEQTQQLSTLLSNPTPEQSELAFSLLVDRVPPGVDPAARIKAEYLESVAQGSTATPLIDRRKAVELLGTMLGGYNVPPLIRLLNDPDLADTAARALSGTLFVFDSFDDVKKLADSGNRPASAVLKSWADAEWFTRQPEIPGEFATVVYKVDGETNTDDFSPAKHATTRPDIPLHALAMGESRFPEGIAEIDCLHREHGIPVAFVGDVIGTGSSRKSACNSLIWHIGEDIPHIPNKRRRGFILGPVIAPIFFNTAEDSGALPLRCDVSPLDTGDTIRIRPHDGVIADQNGEVISKFELRPTTLLDEFRAGGRVPLIIGKQLTERARNALGLEPATIFATATAVQKPGVGYTLAQKIVGKACGLDGVHPGSACLPRMTTVGSQDTTGPMTSDEIKELACLSFQSDLFLQSFCHTAAYPREVDERMHHDLPPFVTDRGGIALKPGDGVIHSWINRMLLPDTLGTGGDSHTRFPVGLSFPAGSGLVAFAGALGIMPLEMPESVLVSLKGSLRPGIALRDVVNAIPFHAIENGLLTKEKKNKKNVFNGRVLEIEGLPDLHVEQAFELTDATAERSAAGGTIALNRETVVRFLKSNAALLKSLAADGYEDRKTIERRIAAMEAWIETPDLLIRDENAEYAAILEIDLDRLTEPILACPNDPDDVRLLSEAAGQKIDEVFIGSCMTNIGHFRAASRILEGAGTRAATLWITPPTRMDRDQLAEEGVLAIFEKAGARVEIPGCSLCMGNQARVGDNAVVFSTSTRNFDNRMGDGARVFLGSAELAALCAATGRIPAPDEYFKAYGDWIAGHEETVYRYLDFHTMGLNGRR